jgi:hypothetical protein
MNTRLIMFLGQTYTNLKRSEISYNNYLNDKKKFIHAKILKECNEQIRKLLLENSFLLSDSLQQDALNLISHYDIWIEKWKDLESKMQPDLDDEFVFQNTVSFPKSSSINLEKKYLELKTNLSF